MYDPKIIDIEGVMSRLDGDRELFLELVDIFFQESNSILGALDDAIQSQNSNALKASAHTLKGAAGNVGAVVVQETSFSLEQLGRSGTCEGAASQVVALKEQVEDFRRNFAKYSAL